MATTTISPAGFTLHGFARADEEPKPTSAPAICFKLSDSLLEDVKKASGVQGGLQFVAGNAPKIRVGRRTIDLTISPEAFRHELYSASTESIEDLHFVGAVSHRAELKLPERKQSLGSDAAIAALQSKLASYKQEKEAKSVNISSNVVAEPKNRWEAAKEQKRARRRGLLGHFPGSPTIGASTPRDNTVPTSFAADDSATRMQAMKTPLIHLLAMKPLGRNELLEKTHIPKDDLGEILGRIGREDQGRWQLTDRAYKDLDVWKFAYSSQDDRKAAVDNAIRAYDRLRLGKDEKLWQKLLPERDRDKGIVLSKLHLGMSTAGAGMAPSPLLHADGGEDSNGPSTVNTPRLGPSAATTPKAAGAKGSSGALSKRLFAKDPKKRAAEESREKKRKEKEAAAALSDREGAKQPPRKKQATRTNNPKVKSEELVHSSSDDSDGEIKGGSTPSTGSSLPKAAANDRKPAANTAKPKPRPVDAASPNPSDAVIRQARPRALGAATPKTGAAAKPASSSANKPTKPSILGKNTPNGLSAPASQSRSALSPQKPGGKPRVPSPLGAARPRVASDVSDRGALGVQRVRQGAETPKGLGITNGVRRRQDTVNSTDSYASTRSEKMNGDHSKTSHRPGINGTETPKAPTSNVSMHHKDNQGVKRKALDSPYQALENGNASKHRKTESTSSQSQKSSVGANSSVEHRLERSASSDSASSIINDITYPQGVTIAQKFREEYYPRYAKLYDEQLAMEKRGETVPKEERDRLWTMHRRLEQMKREIRAASMREHLDE